MTSKYEVTIKDNGINILERKQVFDGDGNPAGWQNHGKAIGIGDFTTFDGFQTGVESMLESVYGANIAGLVARAAAAEANAKALTSERDKLLNDIVNRDVIIAEFTARESTAEANAKVLTAERDKLLDDIADLQTRVNTVKL